MKYSVLNVLKQKIDGRLTHFFEHCKLVSEKNYLTNVYGLARSVLAMGTLITLLFNDVDYLYVRHLFDVDLLPSFLDNYNLFFLVGFDHLWLGKLIACLILLVVIIGIYPRITGILHWWVAMSFFNSAAIIDGGDQISTVITLLLVPLTLLDNRKNHWKKGTSNSLYTNFMAFCMLVMIEIQVAIIYFQSGVEKPYKVPEWLDGTAIYYWFNHNGFGAPDWMLFIIDPILNSSILISTLNWGVIIFEIGLFGCLFMSKSRRLKWLKYAIAFHFMILLVHGLISFFFAISAALILYLAPKELSIQQIWKKKGGNELDNQVPEI